MQAWEQKKHAAMNDTKSGISSSNHKMRTYNQSNKSKKSLKKEAKKKA